MLWRFKVKESMHFVEQKQTLVKMKRNRKCKIPHTVLERRTLCFSSYKNRKLKVKLWWVGAREKKGGYFLYYFFWCSYRLPRCHFSQAISPCLRRTSCSYHVTYMFLSSTLYSCLNVKGLLSRDRRDIWSLSGCSGTRTHNHLVRERALSHAKLP